MAIFDYKGYDNATSVELVQTSYQLAQASSLPNFFDIDTGALLEGALDILGDGAVTGGAVDLSLPEGWSQLTVADLGLPAELEDSMGMIKIESPLTGWLESGPQVKILQETDAEGNVTGLAVSFAGTNSPVDIVDYLQLQTGEIAPYLEPILTAVRAYAEAHGLAGEDVLVTGYSLGGGMTNVMAEYADTLADGFFANSDYIAHDAPNITEDVDRILNVGWENDVVFRVVGDQPTVTDAVEASSGILVPPDYDLETSTDNLVLFDGAYSSPLWPFGEFSLINIPGGWAGHITGMMSTAFSRIIDSEFYDLTERDSVIVVSELGAGLRETTWVWDKPASNHDRPYSPSIVIGTDYDDLLKDNTENDYLDGRAGDDTLRVSDGNNRVSGGEGEDTLRLEGYHSDWTVYRMADGTLFVDKNDGTSLNEVTGVEWVEFEGLALGDLSTISWTYSVQSDRLEDEHWSLFEWGDNDLGYSAAVEGSAGDDVLSAHAVFGREGNDTITGTGHADVLHGGQGDDQITGQSGDRLYSAEGDDVLIAESGDVMLNGGWGDDSFVLRDSVEGSVSIADFDALATGDDHLVLSSDLGDADTILSALVQDGDDVVLSVGEIDVTFTHTEISAFTADDFVFV